MSGAGLPTASCAHLEEGLLGQGAVGLDVPLGAELYREYPDIARSFDHELGLRNVGEFALHPLQELFGLGPGLRGIHRPRIARKLPKQASRARRDSGSLGTGFSFKLFKDLGRGRHEPEEAGQLVAGSRLDLAMRAPCHGRAEQRFPLWRRSPVLEQGEEEDDVGILQVPLDHLIDRLLAGLRDRPIGIARPRRSLEDICPRH